MKTPKWYQEAIFYELYVRAFRDTSGDGNGDLRGVIEKLDYINELGVDCIWLLPIYPSPLKDDGYDISDYFGIHPDFGSLDDLKDLIREVHDRDMRIILDLVVNHVSDEHKWFQEGRKDPKSPYHDYFVWSDSKDRYAETRIIFLDTEESNWTWDEVAEKYYWHRFFDNQPDLNYDNPAVEEEIIKVMDYWLSLGIDGFRVDAVPYLIEREGTNCENLPETHAILKRMRRFTDEHYPDCVMMCEANQWPEDVREYFGDGDEFHMGFNFPLMPRIYQAVAQKDATPIYQIMKSLPEIPEDCQWTNFLRNHDELTLEMVTEEVRQFMWRYYAPNPRMKSNLGIRRRMATLMDNSDDKIALINSIMFTMPGTPIMYYGDEIGMGDNIWLPDRNGVRTPMQWSDAKNGGFSEAEKTYSPIIDDDVYGYKKVNVDAVKADRLSIYYQLRDMILKRKSSKVLQRGEVRWLESDDKELLSFERVLGDEKLTIVHNLSDRRKEVYFDGMMIDIYSGAEYENELQPYEFVWLKEYKEY